MGAPQRASACDALSRQLLDPPRERVTRGHVAEHYPGGGRRLIPRVDASQQKDRHLIPRDRRVWAVLRRRAAPRNPCLGQGFDKAEEHMIPGDVHEHRRGWRGQYGLHRRERINQPKPEIGVESYGPAINRRARQDLANRQGGGRRPHGLHQQGGNARDVRGRSRRSAEGT